MNLIRNQSSRSQLARQILQIFNYLMIGMYICLGIYLLVKGWFALSKTQSVGIGVLLIVYAIFRLYRVLKENRMKEVNDETSDN